MLSPMRTHRQILHSIVLFIPIFLLVSCVTHDYAGNVVGNPEQRPHRQTASSYGSALVTSSTNKFQITLTGTPGRLPQSAEYMYLEHVLFAYLNKALTPRKIQISSVVIDTSKTRIQDGSFVRAASVLSPGRTVEEKIEDDDKYTRAATRVDSKTEDLLDNGRNHIQPNRALSEHGSSANKLIVEAIIRGRDLSLVSGEFENDVKGAINIGFREIINQLTRPADAEEFFKGVSWIGITNVSSAYADGDGSSPGRVSSTPNFTDEEGPNAEEAVEDAELENEIDLMGMGSNTQEVIRPSKSLKNAKAVQFRIISGSIFLSLCLTAILSNTIRILARQRDERRKRMEKAKQAYEAPTRAMMRGPSEKFVGMLDDGGEQGMR